MNPSLKLILALIISLEVTFSNHLGGNLVIIVGALAYLLWHHTNWRHLLWPLLITLIPAGALFCTIAYFSPEHNIYFAWVLVSRLYVYVTVGTCVTYTTTTLDLIHSLEQNCHLPATFAYGLLGALNLVPRIKHEIVNIRVAGQMRGVTLHWWSPRLYFKAILAANQWADQLAQAMETHGFIEGAPRSHISTIKVTRRDWLVFITLLLLVQVAIIALH